MSTRRILRIQVNSAQGLPSKTLGSKPTAHVALTIDGRTRETVPIKNDCHPSWHNMLEFDFEPKEKIETMNLEVDVIDNGLLGKSKIGHAKVILSEYTDGEEHAISVPLEDKKEKSVGELSLTISLLEPAKPSKH